MKIPTTTVGNIGQEDKEGQQRSDKNRLHTLVIEGGMGVLQCDKLSCRPSFLLKKTFN